MINWEKEGIKKCQKETQELLKINDEYQKVFEEKMKNHDRLIQQIKQNLVYKKNVDGVFGRSDNVIERSAFQQVEKMKSDQQTQDIIRKQKERQDKNQNKQRDIGNQLEEQRLEYEKLKEVIDIQKQDYKQSPQFQEFMASQEKEADLRSILLERDYQIYDLQKLLEQKQNKLEILEKAYKQQQKNDQQQREKEAQQQEQEQQKTNQNQEKQQQQPQKQKTQQDQTPKNAEGENNNQNQSENKNTEENKQEGEENQQQQEQNSEKKEEQKSENNEQQQQENQEQEKPQNQENQDQQQQQNENQEKSEQQQQNEGKQQNEAAAEESEEVDYDEEDPNMPADPDHLQIYFDGKANQHYKIEQTRLAVIGIIQTSQQKLNLKQSSNVKETIRFDVEEMKSALQEKLDLIKSKLDPEDYENFMGGTYDKNKMYKGLVDDITEYGYEEEPGDDAFEESSVNDY